MPNSSERAPREGHRLGHPFFQHIADFRRAGLHIGAAQQGHPGGDGRLRRPDLHSLDVARHDDLLGLGMEGERIEDEGEAVLHVLHLVRRVFAVPAVDRAVAAVGIADQERQFARGDDREAAGLVAGVDVGEVGDAVARHVVMIEGLAELLRRIDLVFDGAAGIFFDRGAPSPRSPSAADATAAPNATASARRSCPAPRRVPIPSARPSIAKPQSFIRRIRVIASSR